jgi:[acyl-carrier-protein] S-malonyltransferase
VRAALAEVAIGVPSVPVVTNVRAAPESAPEVLRARLAEQVTARVRWRESLLAIAGLGVDTVVELGAGRVLSGLTKRTLPAVATVALGAPAEIAAFVATLSD